MPALPMLLQAEEAKPGGAPRKGRAVSPGLLARMKAFSNDESDSNRQRPAQGMSPRRSVSPRLKERVNSFSRPGQRSKPSPRADHRFTPGQRHQQSMVPRSQHVEQQQEQRTPVLSGTSTLKPAGGNYSQSSAQHSFAAQAHASSTFPMPPPPQHNPQTLRPDTATQRVPPPLHPMVTPINTAAVDKQRDWLASMMSEMSDRGGLIDSEDDDESGRKAPSSPKESDAASAIFFGLFGTADEDETAVALKAAQEAQAMAAAEKEKERAEKEARKAKAEAAAKARDDMAAREAMAAKKKEAREREASREREQQTATAMAEAEAREHAMQLQAPAPPPMLPPPQQPQSQQPLSQPQQGEPKQQQQPPPQQQPPQQQNGSVPGSPTRDRPQSRSGSSSSTNAGGSPDAKRSPRPSAATSPAGGAGVAVSPSSSLSETAERVHGTSPDRPPAHRLPPPPPPPPPQQSVGGSGLGGGFRGGGALFDKGSTSSSPTIKSATERSIWGAQSTASCVSSVASSSSASTAYSSAVSTVSAGSPPSATALARAAARAAAASSYVPPVPPVPISQLVPLPLPRRGPGVALGSSGYTPRDTPRSASSSFSAWGGASDGTAASPSSRLSIGRELDVAGLGGEQQPSGILPNLGLLWRSILDARDSTRAGVDDTARSHETETATLLRLARRYSKKVAAVVRDGGGEAALFELDYPVGFPADPAEAAREWRRFARLKSEGLTANNAGDARQALRRLYDAALIYPSCANVLSVANMHLKVGHPTLAAPLYYHVLHASEATKKEQLMANAKLQAANKEAAARHRANGHDVPPGYCGTPPHPGGGSASSPSPQADQRRSGSSPSKAPSAKGRRLAFGEVAEGHAATTPGGATGSVGSSSSSNDVQWAAPSTAALSAAGEARAGGAPSGTRSGRSAGSSGGDSNGGGSLVGSPSTRRSQATLTTASCRSHCTDVPASASPPVPNVTNAAIDVTGGGYWVAAGSTPTVTNRTCASAGGSSAVSGSTIRTEPRTAAAPSPSKDTGSMVARREATIVFSVDDKAMGGGGGGAGGLLGMAGLAPAPATPPKAISMPPPMPPQLPPPKPPPKYGGAVVVGARLITQSMSSRLTYSKTNVEDDPDDEEEEETSASTPIAEAPSFSEGNGFENAFEEFDDGFDSEDGVAEEEEAAAAAAAAHGATAGAAGAGEVSAAGGAGLHGELDEESLWEPPAGWRGAPGGGQWTGGIPSELRALLSSSSTLRAVLSSLPQLDASEAANLDAAAAAAAAKGSRGDGGGARGYPPGAHGAWGVRGEVESGGVCRLEIPLRALRMFTARGGYPLLPAGEELGFDHLQLHTPTACDGLLSLLCAGLYASSASVHLPPPIGWALRGTTDWRCPSPAAVDLPTLPRGSPQSLCVWVRAGTPLMRALVPPAGSGLQPFDYAALYPMGTAAPPPSVARRAARLRAKKRAEGGSEGRRSAAQPTGGAKPASPDGSSDASSDAGSDVPPLGLWRLQSGGYSSPTKDGVSSNASLPPPPTDPAEVFGDYCLFAIVHTLSLLQAALELQHNDSLLDLVQLCDAKALSSNGRSLAGRDEYRYSWGGSTYAFLPSSLVPIVAGMKHASARLDGILLDVPAPTLQQPLTPSADLQAFWKRARSQIRCGEVVRRRLHALLMQGAPYDHFSGDPWEQYRVSVPPVSRGSSPAAAPPVAVPKRWVSGKPALEEGAEAHEGGGGEIIATLQFEWMPEPLAGRDCSCALLTRLRSDALLELRDRARAEADNARGHASSSPSSAAGGGRPALPGGKAPADVLQDLYLKARIREADEVAKAAAKAKVAEVLCARLESLSPRRVERAIKEGWDGLETLIEAELGDGAWTRTVTAVPDEWEEDEALEALADVLRRPTQSQHLWLLTQAEGA